MPWILFAFLTACYAMQHILAANITFWTSKTHCSETMKLAAKREILTLGGKLEEVYKYIAL